MKIVIVGPGAMGCLFAALLIRSGNDVWLLDHNVVRVEKLKNQGLNVEGLSGEYQIPLKQIAAHSEHISKTDLLIIFVKAYDTDSAIKNAIPLISKETIILTLQNGLGNVEKIKEVCSGIPIIAGTTAQGATLLGDGHIRHAGAGETIIGAVNESSMLWLERIQDLFEKAGIKTRITSDVKGLLWGKLLINSGINPITALMRITNGELLNYSNLVNVMRRAVTEGAVIARAQGISLPFNDPLKKVEEVCLATAQNRSSMLQDIEGGKKTEINYLNGAVVRYGKKLGLTAPVNALLTNLVQSLEEMQRRC